ncbi:MAG: DUF2029 domain-containing protein [Actinobacteria bacterium]|nr:DUF2029 domain-containing protein [Actinomycetota bacterium]
MKRLTMNRLTSLISSIYSAERGRRSADDIFLIVEAGVAAVVTVRMVAAAVGLNWPDTPFTCDFMAFWTSGWLVRDGAGPAFFDMERQQAVQVALRQAAAATEVIRSAPSWWYYPFLNPPPLALVFVPLTFLPIQIAFLLWSVLSLAAFVVAVAVQLRGASHGWGIAVMLLTFGGMTLTLLEGQVNAIFLLAFSLAMLAFSRRRPIAGGMLLGVLWLKFQYALPFAMLLLVKGRWRELFGMAITAAITGALTLAMIGPAGIVSYIAEMQRISAFRPSMDAPVLTNVMVNWRGIVTNLWPDVPDDVGAALVLLLGVATVLVALLAWRGEWAPDSPRFARQMLLLTLATVVASPHSQFGGTVLLLAPLAALLARSPTGIAPVAGWRTLLVAGLLLSVIFLAVAALRWLMALYLLAALAMLLLLHPVAAKDGPTVPAAREGHTIVRPRG